MEPKLPRLNNLAGHVSECKGAKDDKKTEEPTSEEKINLKCSAEIMEAYLKEGELNPEVVATYKGFLRIFSAWIFDESLPWTTGEAPTLQMLFKYLKITYQLPSDTTVRNQLAMQWVFLFTNSSSLILRVLPGSQVQDCVCDRYMDHTANCVYVCLLDWVFHQRRLGNH
jgi:hypothetical protein